MTAFAPMPETEIGPYLERTAVEFADDLVRGGDAPPETALADARALLAKVLPDGPGTTGHHFRRFVVDGAAVANVWFAEQPDEDPPRVYLFDIRVDEGRRGRGHGTAAMHALEEEARRLGARQLMLSVFFHNAGAVRLYERLGFTPDERGQGGMRMSKSL